MYLMSFIGGALVSITFAYSNRGDSDDQERTRMSVSIIHSRNKGIDRKRGRQPQKKTRITALL